MKYPNAYKGVKKLFIVEIICIVAALILLVSAIMAAIGLQNEPVLVAAGSVGLAASIALIVAFILQLVGLYQGGKDEIGIKYGFYFTIGAVVLGIAASILSGIGGNQVVSVITRVVNTLADIAAVCALVYTLIGISRLAEQLGDENMATRGRRLVYLVLILYVVSIILNVYPGFVPDTAPEFVKTIVAITGILAAIAELVVYILTVVYYAKATKMLEK